MQSSIQSPWCSAMQLVLPCDCWLPAAAPAAPSWALPAACPLSPFPLHEQREASSPVAPSSQQARRQPPSAVSAAAPRVSRPPARGGEAALHAACLDQETSLRRRRRTHLVLQVGVARRQLAPRRIYRLRQSAAKQAHRACVPLRRESAAAARARRCALPHFRMQVSGQRLVGEEQHLAPHVRGGGSGC